MQIRDRVVLITGASDGIGAACAESFRRRGALLALTGRSAEKLARAAQEGDEAIPANLCDAGSRREVVKRTLARFGRIDILVNNAGVGAYSPSWESSDAETREMFELNFFAPLDMVRLAAPSMRERRSGCIVNVSSIAGKVTLPWITLYSASKCALGSFSDGLRMELAHDGIRVLTVCPGYVKTDFQKHALGGGGVPERVARSRRFAVTPEQCAEALVRGVERDARTVLAPPVIWAMVAAARLFPGLFDRQLARMRSDGDRA